MGNVVLFLFFLREATALLAEGMISENQRNTGPEGVISKNDRNTGSEGAISKNDRNGTRRSDQ